MVQKELSPRNTVNEREIRTQTVLVYNLQQGYLLPWEPNSPYQGIAEVKLVVSRQLGSTYAKQRRLDAPGRTSVVWHKAGAEEMSQEWNPTRFLPHWRADTISWQPRTTRYASLLQTVLEKYKILRLLSPFGSSNPAIWLPWLEATNWPAEEFLKLGNLKIFRNWETSPQGTKFQHFQEDRNMWQFRAHIPTWPRPAGQLVLEGRICSLHSSPPPSALLLISSSPFSGLLPQWHILDIGVTFGHFPACHPQNTYETSLRVSHCDRYF